MKWRGFHTQECLRGKPIYPTGGPLLLHTHNWGSLSGTWEKTGEGRGQVAPREEGEKKRKGWGFLQHLSWSASLTDHCHVGRCSLSAGLYGKKDSWGVSPPLPSSGSSFHFFTPPPWNHMTLIKIKNEQEQVSGSKLCEPQFFQLLTPSSPLGKEASMNHKTEKCSPLLSLGTHSRKWHKL